MWWTDIIPLGTALWPALGRAGVAIRRIPLPRREPRLSREAIDTLCECAENGSSIPIQYAWGTSQVTGTLYERLLVNELLESGYMEAVTHEYDYESGKAWLITTPSGDRRSKKEILRRRHSGLRKRLPF